MKSVTPTQARKNWFRLLDEVAAGETVHIRRGDKLIVLKCETGPSPSVADYSDLISGKEVGEADQWGWQWSEEGIVPSP
jgi:antitoxin (DNA-binding transcriptional repressor) of toxin-antitoxin stability system